MTFITLNVGNLLEAAKDMYVEIETLATIQEQQSGCEMSIDMQEDLDKWFDIIKQYDPLFLVDQDECVPLEDK